MTKIFSAWLRKIALVLLGFTIPAQAQETRILTVVSAYGTPDPAVGAHSLPVGGIVTATCPAVVEIGTGNIKSRKACIGWTGMGSVPAEGTKTSVAFTLEEDSTITWNWIREHLLSFSPEGEGVVKGTAGWYSEEETVRLYAVSDSGSQFDEWTGDTEGCALQGVYIRVPMDRPRNITARFKYSGTVKDVSARQRQPWSSLVDIDYKIEDVEDPDRMFVCVAVEDRETGRTYDALSLDRVPPVTNGTHRITWNPEADGVAFQSSNTVYSVALCKGKHYMAVDLSTGTNTTNYPVSYRNKIPGGKWTDEYKTTNLVLRWISPGTFQMGSPTNELMRNAENEDPHSVTLTKPFYIGVFQVTQKQYELVMGENPSQKKGPRCPVGSVSHDDLKATPFSFIERIRRRTGMNCFDLPTEAQWEYACRAGTTTVLNTGKNISRSSSCPEMDEAGRYMYNGGKKQPDYKDVWRAFAIVGSYLKNEWGLYDMHGNINEWCRDGYVNHLGTTAVTDPIGPISALERVVRGGSWSSSAIDCRSASRFGSPPNAHDDLYGFRLFCSYEARRDAFSAAASGPVTTEIPRKTGAFLLDVAQKITFSDQWDGFPGGTSIVAEAETPFFEGTGEGFCNWMPAVPGLRRLTYTEGGFMTNADLFVMRDAVVGYPYSFQLGTEWGSAPYTWTLAGGTLPEGISLSSGGVLSGMTYDLGLYSFTAEIRDARHQTMLRDFPLRTRIAKAGEGKALTVFSAHGNPSPAIGRNPFLAGTEIHASVPLGGISLGDGSRAVLTGCTGTGSVPMHGTTNNAVFMLTEDSSLTWNWQREHWLAISSAGNGMVTGEKSGWMPEGENITLVAVANPDYAFNEWTGNIEGGRVLNSRIILPMNRPRTIRATFKLIFDLAAALDTTNLVWKTSWKNGWRPQRSVSFDKKDAAVCGGIGDMSRLSTELKGPGTLTFRWKLSKDIESSAVIDFFVDDDCKCSLSEESEWMEFSTRIESGKHAISWEAWRYNADRGLAYVDQVQWVPDDMTGFTVHPVPVPVPYAWLAEYGLASEGVCEAAALASAANGMKVWECYVAGLDPSDRDAKFIITIDPDGGKSILEWDPHRDDRVYTIEGKTNLTDNAGGNGGWIPLTNNAPKTLAETEGLHFFRVKASLPVGPDGMPLPAVYSVTVDAAGGAGASGAGKYGPESPVTVSAGMKTGYTFTNWSAVGVSLLHDERNPLTFTMPMNDVALMANWNLTVYSVIFDAAGGIGATRTGKYGYEYGSTVTMSAGIKQGYSFTGWDAAGVTLADPSQATVTFAMPANDVTLTALWKPEMYYAVIDATGGAGATSTGKHTCSETVTVYAGADKPHYDFVGWTAVGLVLAGEATEPSLTFVMPANDVFLTANRKPINYAVNVNANGGTNAAGAGEHAYGSTVRVSAGARFGYVFDGWTAVGVTLDDPAKNSVSFTMPGNDVTLTANWTQIQPPPLYLIIDLAGGAAATNYPVRWLNDVPTGGWTDVYKTTKLAMRRIEPGTFTMGSPTNELGRQDNETQHQVILTEPFYIGVFEITQKQWQLVMGNNPSYTKGDARPMEMLLYKEIRGNDAGRNWPASSAVDADSFMGRIRARTGAVCFDLPTEAQWEYACRAGTTTALNTGKNLSSTNSCPEMCVAGRYCYNGGNKPPDYNQIEDAHAKVGSYQPNAWGLYDMHGNVWEWCLDWYADSLAPTAVVNPLGPALSTGLRVWRGGGYMSKSSSCRSASRRGENPDIDIRSVIIGFRAACLLKEDWHMYAVVIKQGGMDALGAGNYPKESTVTVTAGTKTGYTFNGWTATGITLADPSTNSVTFTMPTNNVALTANWEPIVYTVTMDANGGTGAEGTGNYAYGSTVTVNAGTKHGYSFNEWTATGISLTNPASDSVTFIMPANDVMLTANWKWTYLVIDLSDGASAESYPVSGLDAPPEGGWTDEYKTTKLVLRWIQQSTFTMGSPTNELGHLGRYEPQHEVMLTRSFYIGVFEVTQKQWELVMGNKPSSYWGDCRPVEGVGYYTICGSSEGKRWPMSAGTDEESFLGRLRARTGLAFDLPTEAQWEYACRAGTTTALNTGKNLSAKEKSPEMDEAGRYQSNQFDNKGGYNYNHTTVGSYLPNAWGLYDMHGNVQEWCRDLYGDYPKNAVTDPAGAASGKNRILRGGNWSSNGCECRSAKRNSSTPDIKESKVGFRLCGGNRPAWKLSVSSSYNSQNSNIYGYWFPDGDSGSAYCNNSQFVVFNRTRKYTGWTGTGSVPSSGTGTNVSFTLNENSSIMWGWGRVEHQISIETSGPGWADSVHEWVKEGEDLIVHLTKKDTEATVQIGGDVDGVTLDGLTMRIPADRPRTVEVTFGNPDPKRYIVIDLSNGTNAANYPVTYLASKPAGGWTDEYKTTNLVMRRIEPGTFTMGSPTYELGRYSDEMTQHPVTLTKPFYIGIFELTQKQWELVMGNAPSVFKGNCRPVAGVSYKDIRGATLGAGWPSSSNVDADSFMGRLRTRTGLAFDLPTEAQWEYACRAGTTTALNSGKDLTNTTNCPNATEISRYSSNRHDGKGGYSEYTTVGSYLPNAWGLYDMHGNVWEWCLDWYKEGNYPANAEIDPKGPTPGSDPLHVLRSGSWNSPSRYCRSAKRNFDTTSSPIFYQGFRPVCLAK